MNREKYLPIGSVVLLKNAKKRVMVTGFAVRGKEMEDKMFDYIGCLYPEGVITTDKNLLFNHEQIDQIFYLGYVDDEWKNLEPKLKEIVKNAEAELSQKSANAEETTIEPSNSNDLFSNQTTDLFS